MFGNGGLNFVPIKFDFLFKINIFLFLNYFDVLILKIKFLNYKNIILIYF
jgi:hypothetical protein